MFISKLPRIVYINYHDLSSNLLKVELRSRKLVYKSLLYICVDYLKHPNKNKKWIDESNKWYYKRKNNNFDVNNKIDENMCIFILINLYIRKLLYLIFKKFI